MHDGSIIIFKSHAGLVAVDDGVLGLPWIHLVLSEPQVVIAVSSGMFVVQTQSVADLVKYQVVLEAIKGMDKYVHPHKSAVWNKRVSQMRAPLAARREPAEAQNRPPSVLYVCEHKTYCFSNPRYTHPHRGILTYQ